MLKLQDNQIAEALYVGTAGFALLCYVFGVLVSQPEIPLVMNVIFPKLSGESAYSLMALLGANIMAHNFYIHSAVVQVKVIIILIWLMRLNLCYKSNSRNSFSWH